MISICISTFSLVLGLYFCNFSVYAEEDVDFILLENSVSTLSTNANLDDYDYKISKNKVTIRKYSGLDSNVIIPDSIEGYPVEKIDESAFSGCSNIEYIYIPDSVSSIGKFAFSRCENLKDIDLPNSIKRIETGTFRSCENLVEVNVPNSVTSIGNSAFAECSHLERIYIPNSVSSIEAYAFTECVNLQNIDLPDSISKIEPGIFDGCKNLKSVNWPKSITTISDSTFRLCENLVEIDISTVTYIEDAAFAGCISIKFEDLTSIQSIGYNGFAGCSSIENILLSEKILYIDKNAFSSCDSLQSVTFMEGNYKLERISEGAFNSCKSLKNINLPDSVEKIETSAFSGCSSLKSIYIPESVTSIGTRAFSGCENLSEINLPENLAELGVAFISGTNVENISIHSDLEILPQIWANGSGFVVGEAGVFQGAEKLKQVTIDEGVTTIPNYMFSCSTLETIELPKTIVTVDDNAFSYCSNLKKVAMWDNIENIVDGEYTEPFSSSDQVVIYGPIGSYVETYAKSHNITFRNIDDFEIDIIEDMRGDDENVYREVSDEGQQATQDSPETDHSAAITADNDIVETSDTDNNAVTDNSIDMNDSEISRSENEDNETDGGFSVPKIAVLVIPFIILALLVFRDKLNKDNRKK